ncbi:MAG TPA: 4-(cytidine 5'-diphospho)-2-C-methyl-D-erythritol kinase [Vicinamibacterales bacterium]|nr:4-(cytidine 5'-diphospho)-2-C-methyl-D-erythritol kinase [Vicinamibacterales bacterium]HPW21610.1 4-(cytidine 5'-diphospho)-2-C-methyl-D-erythritol kinase [Vicinamibacterales bacterium]
MTAGVRPIRVRAHAKINLELRVGEIGPDRYHPLRTVFQSIALHDVVEVRRRPGPFELTSDDPSLPTDGRNLVAQAAVRLWEAIGRGGAPRGVAVRLVKHIPAQAGLGGGSADAAAALAVLARVWRARLDPAGLAALAAGIGADVPYFLTGGTALGLGRGDVIYPLQDIAPHSVVLALPASGVSTAEAYGWFDDDRAVRLASARVGAPPVTGLWPSSALSVGNDLEGPVARRRPEIAAIKQALIAGGARAAAMTGSGSAVFGLFAGEARARAAARAVAAEGYAAWLTRTVDRRACQRIHFPIAPSPARRA